MNIDEIGGWFDPCNRLQLELLIAEHDIHSVLEIGSFLGLSSIWFAQRVWSVTCVDKWREDANVPDGNNLLSTLLRFGTPRDFFHVFLHNIKEFEVDHKITPVRGLSTEVHGLVTDHDLVYLDGDHSYEGCARDLQLYGPKARRVLCGDDFVDRPEFGVIQAVEEYADATNQRLRTGGPFWWIEK